MRVALALHGWPPRRMGGTGLYVEALAGALVELGQEVSLLAPGPAARAIIEWVPCIPGTRAALLGAPPLQRWEQTWTQPGRASLLDAWLDAAGPDVLHIHHLSGLPWSLPARARARGVRTVLTLHDYALPCGRGQLVDQALRPCPGPEPTRCARCLSEQLGLTPARARAGRLLERLPTLRRLARRSLGRLRPGGGDEARIMARNTALHDVLRHTDVLLSPSEDLARRFQAMGLGHPDRCELPLIGPVPVAPDPGSGPLRLLFASALLPTKGPDRLLAAFARLPPGAATLTLAGPTPDFDGRPGFAADLRAVADRTPGVRWVGEVPPERMPALLAEHDVLVLPSTWPENSPLVVREATAAGLRVIVGAAGGAGELAPEARRVPSDPEDEIELYHTLQAEIQHGRGRLSPRRWPTALEHARWLLESIYPDRRR